MQKRKPVFRRFRETDGVAEEKTTTVYDATNRTRWSYLDRFNHTFLSLSYSIISDRVFLDRPYAFICTAAPSGIISICDCPHGKPLRCIGSYIQLADSPLTVSWDLSLITMLPDGWPNRTLDHILLFLVIYFYRSRRILSEFDKFSAIDARLHTSILHIFRLVHSLNCRALVGHRNHPSALCVYNIQ